MQFPTEEPAVFHTIISDFYLMCRMWRQIAQRDECKCPAGCEIETTAALAMHSMRQPGVHEYLNSDLPKAESHTAMQGHMAQGQTLVISNDSTGHSVAKQSSGGRVGFTSQSTRVAVET